MRLTALVQNDKTWLQSLRDTGDVQTSSVLLLRAMLVKALSAALRHRDGVDASQVEDFAQDALLRIMQNLDRYEGRSKFTTWAIAIAIDTAAAQLRRKHWQNISLETLIEQGGKLEDFIGSAAAPADSEDQGRILRCLRQIVAKQLTDRQRAAIVGQLQGLSVEELSATLSITPGALYKLLHDARRSLKQHLLATGITAGQIRAAFAS